MDTSEKTLEPTKEQLREWAQNMGRVRSPAKKEAALKRWQTQHQLTPGRKSLPLDALKCTCDSDGKPDKKGFTHKSSCPRGRAERRRAKDAAPAQPIHV